MFKKLFGKKTEEIVTSPVTGKLVQLEDVPDPVFSERMMGDGLAIEPAEGVVVAPLDAKVLQVFPTKHAVGLQTDNGIEILIHIGLETVSLNGEGFESFVKVGDKVKKGDKLVTFDLAIIKEKAKSTVTPIIITNGDLAESIDKTTEVQLKRGETPLLTIKPK
ncbi:PTS glucose transporter subunit IIA [Peribacillus cavernae]|uniref:PTS glucose transporter subunit IIA n=1 Tax=Peribacillus cavernae TaxID=1674310 RepID=A0A3S1BC76_9BACI|nr:PTS glucose transporter subunit IIA [Peribacillus cavernae]MDQ0217961.1 PTS system glucose-specific IIA component [Peribacillus cavernae]RUQ32606.1 PTS glucose transporter subunit IIA [Peribacillus cavernae]